MVEIMKSKNVGLNGLIRRENNRQKCKFHLSVEFIFSLFYTSQAFDMLLIPYKILLWENSFKR